MATIHDEIKEFRDGLSSKRHSGKEVATYRKYAKGSRIVTLTAKQKRVLKDVNYDELSDNVCEQIIQESADRIVFKGWSCLNNETLHNFLEKIYLTRNLRVIQGMVTYNALCDGDTVVSLSWNNETKRVDLLQEDWWDGVEGVYIHYSEDGVAQFAVKEWRKTNVGEATVTYTYYRTVYFPDRIERYESPVGTQGSWAVRRLADDPEGPVPFVDPSTNEPIGIPFIHFTNFRSGRLYGTSELAGGIIGLQDLLNKDMISMATCSALTGGQQYYATGVKLRNKVGTKEPIEVEVEPGKMHTSSEPSSKFGVLPAGDMTQIIAGYTTKLKRIAQISRLPLHVISGGDWPSGDALLRAELPAVNKAHKQIMRFAQGYLDLASMIVKLYRVFGGESSLVMDEDTSEVMAIFEDPEKRDDISRSIIVHNLAGTISKKEALRIMNKSEEEAQRIYDEMVEENRDAADAMLDAAMRGNTAEGLGTSGKKNKEAEGGKKTTNEDAK